MVTACLPLLPTWRQEVTFNLPFMSLGGREAFSNSELVGTTQHLFTPPPHMLPHPSTHCLPLPAPAPQRCTRSVGLVGRVHLHRCTAFHDARITLFLQFGPGSLPLVTGCPGRYTHHTHHHTAPTTTVSCRTFTITRAAHGTHTTHRATHALQHHALPLHCTHTQQDIMEHYTCPIPTYLWLHSTLLGHSGCGTSHTFLYIVTHTCSSHTACVGFMPLWTHPSTTPTYTTTLPAHRDTTPPPLPHPAHTHLPLLPLPPPHLPDAYRTRA